MIEIIIHRRGNQYAGFVSKGHAGYAEEGYDIICAAVSVLTVNTINSIEAFTTDHFAVRQGDGLSLIHILTKRKDFDSINHHSI